LRSSRKWGRASTGFAPGDRVAVEGFAYDGDCAYCRQGRYNHCLSRIWFWGAGHGGLSEHSTMHVSTISGLPGHFSFEQWALRLPLDDVGVAFRSTADKRSGSIKVQLVQS
jgi:threonine dehydrogenase-like Zn-dependent dehydrogenase